MATTNHSLTQNVWVKVADYNGNRNYCRISDHSLSGNQIRFAFTENPHSLNFVTNTDVDVSAILSDPNSYASATKTYIRMRFMVVSSTGVLQTLFSVSDQSANTYFQLYWGTTDRLGARVVSGGTTSWLFNSMLSLSVNTWYTVTFVHDGVEPKWFIGIEDVSDTFTTDTNKTHFLNNLTGLDKAHIGTIDTNGAGKANYLLNAHVDYVKIMQGDVNNQVALYRFDEGSGTTLGDSFTHSDDGTITLGSGSWDLSTKEKGEKINVISDHYYRVSGEEQKYIHLPIWCITDGASDSVTLLQRS